MMIGFAVSTLEQGRKVYRQAWQQEMKSPLYITEHDGKIYDDDSEEYGITAKDLHGTDWEEYK